jgi:hypothetical protein
MLPLAQLLLLFVNVQICKKKFYCACYLLIYFIFTFRILTWVSSYSRDCLSLIKTTFFPWATILACPHTQTNATLNGQNIIRHLFMWQGTINDANSKVTPFRSPLYLFTSPNGQPTSNGAGGSAGLNCPGHADIVTLPGTLLNVISTSYDVNQHSLRQRLRLKLPYPNTMASNGLLTIRAVSPGVALTVGTTINPITGSFNCTSANCSADYFIDIALGADQVTLLCSFFL